MSPARQVSLTRNYCWILSLIVYCSARACILCEIWTYRLVLPIENSDFSTAFIDDARFSRYEKTELGFKFSLVGITALISSTSLCGHISERTQAWALQSTTAIESSKDGAEVAVKMFVNLSSI